jgi:drug/metabolite transporter (DMT)-like permease
MSATDDVASATDDVASATDDVASATDDVASATDDVASATDDVASAAKPFAREAEQVGVAGRPSRLKLYAIALGAVTLWGASFPITKAALDYTGPTAVAFLRWAISAAVLGLCLAMVGRRNPEQSLTEAGRMLRLRWRTVAWVAFVGISLFYFLQNLALRYTTATNAGVLANLTSVFMVLIGATLLRERLKPVEWAALVAAFVGSALVSQGAGHLQIGGPGLLGDAMMVVAAFTGAVYSIGGKGLSERHPPVVVMTVVAAAGALFLLPVALIEGLNLAMPLRGWALVALLGFGSGALGNLLWLSLLRELPASRAALTLFLIPLIAATLSVTLLGEPVTLLLVIGAGLVLGGVALAQRRA